MFEIERLADLAEQVALKAGELLLNRPKSFDLDEKSGVFDFATQMDHQSEALIVSLIKEARPEDGIFGEEGSALPSKSGLTWVIDPIDGTVNYLYDLPGWCVSIDVKHEGRAIVGVVYAPSLDLIWRGIRGRGATCNGSKIRCNDPVALDRALIATGFAYDVERRVGQADLVNRLLPKIRDIRRTGSCALDISLVASGSIDGQFESGINEWDYAAAALIASEAGAKVTVVEGIWNGAKSFTLVAGPTLHGALSKELAPSLQFPIS